ncbi:hypothetical protein Lepto7376_3854 [[Leptolyngbya] sp. PCC 7376]|uniref:hypothetical protein n=1 Tax=[Leptolyngbya] sp. PCC 7376 TaxID=111781 RepID=UPI00029F0AE4|nr:hypothetical protein [[Leptolyngbya] sp. PCC 7376]AFY40011.1 hypothetical protein Lepto7376_3854 [[Leptolyngbya] sp. PCC 7376]
MDTSTTILFEQGKDAFLQGEYRLSRDFLLEAIANVPKLSREGGELRLWLSNAYQANNQIEDAIDLCRELATHPFPQTAERARRQLYILEAPKLERPKEWLTQIPSMENFESTQSLYVEGKQQPTKKELSIDDFEDLSQIETEDNQFVWVALGLGVVGMTVWAIAGF